MATLSRSKFGLSLLGLMGFLAARGQHQYSCRHCEVGDGFEEFLKPDKKQAGSFHSDVSVLWATHLEVVSITEDIGGWEPASFHKKLAAEAIRGWKNFRDVIAPGLPGNHRLRHQLDQKHAGALNDGFFHFQKTLFELRGDIQASLDDEDPHHDTPPPDANTSWPEMDALPEYQKLRKIVKRLSRRYLIRSGMTPESVHALNYSIFNWAAIHSPGEFHGPHTHVGEYHVGVFYAQTGPGAGKLRFGDPRGHSPPFGRYHYHDPKPGQLILFPSWLSHMATVTAASSDIMREDSYKDEPYRVVFSFNIGPIEGPIPCHYWHSDPTGDMQFTRKSPIDPKQLGV